MKLEVAPIAEVRRDFRRNLRWLLSLLAATFVYALLSSSLIMRMEEGWGFLHSAYFTVINMTTVGFGDVFPSTQGGKVLAGINGFFGLLLFGAIVAVVVLALQPSGRSATLASARVSENSEAPRPLRPTGVNGGIADMLEGLAGVIRSAENDQKSDVETGRVAVHVYSRKSPERAVTEVFIEVWANQALEPTREDAHGSA